MNQWSALYQSFIYSLVLRDRVTDWAFGYAVYGKTGEGKKFKKREKKQNKDTYVRFLAKS